MAPHSTADDSSFAQTPANTVSKDGYEIIEEPIGTRRPLRIVCMGAGYSGVMMGIVYSEKLKGRNASFTIYERNSDLGGTWLENRSAK